MTGTDVVRHWVHAEHLLFDGRKMSKSAGNVVLVDHVADRGMDPLALRLAFLQHRYRQQMNLTWAVIEVHKQLLIVGERTWLPGRPHHRHPSPTIFSRSSCPP